MAAALLAVIAGACRDAAAPVERAPWLAIVARVDGDTAFARALPLRYRVRELSGTLGIDRTVLASPADTVLIPVRPATYGVRLEGLPGACGVRDGTERAIVVPPDANTALIRYSITCATMLTIATTTDGTAPDSQYVLSIVDAAGAVVHARTLAGNGEVALHDIRPGEYTLALGLIDPRCVVTSDGGARPRVRLRAAGGTRVAIRIVCADAAARPELLSVEASFHDGTVGIVFRARDPQRDVERYEWTITDCAGHSLVPGGPLLRRGLGGGRTRGLDTITVLGAMAVPLADSVARRGCLSLRVADEMGNSTPVVQRPLGRDRGRAPVATLAARYVGTHAVRSALVASDADGDLVGTFAMLRVRDGVLVTPADGKPDLALYNRVGYLGVEVPELPFGTILRWDDVYAVVVFVLDRAGNFTMAEDTNLFQ